MSLAPKILLENSSSEVPAFRKFLMGQKNSQGPGGPERQCVTEKKSLVFPVWV